MNKLFYILLFLTLTFPLFAQMKSKDVLLFEIKRSESFGKRHSSSAHYFYKSGRIDCQGETTDPRGKLIKSQKNKCFQTSQAKMTELIGLTEQADFLVAKDSYIIFTAAKDWGGKSFSITYFGKNGKKKISLRSNLSSSEIEEIPLSLKKFLQKMGEINKSLKVEVE